MLCANGDGCVALNDVCDGFAQCNDASDENRDVCLALKGREDGGVGGDDGSDSGGDGGGDSGGVGGDSDGDVGVGGDGDDAESVNVENEGGMRFSSHLFFLLPRLNPFLDAPWHLYKRSCP